MTGATATVLLRSGGNCSATTNLASAQARPNRVAPVGGRSGEHWQVLEDDHSSLLATNSATRSQSMPESALVRPAAALNVDTFDVVAWTSGAGGNFATPKQWGGSSAFDDLSNMHGKGTVNTHVKPDGSKQRIIPAIEQKGIRASTSSIQAPAGGPFSALRRATTSLQGGGPVFGCAQSVTRRSHPASCEQTNRQQKAHSQNVEKSATSARLFGRGGGRANRDTNTNGRMHVSSASNGYEGKDADGALLRNWHNDRPGTNIDGTPAGNGRTPARCDGSNNNPALISTEDGTEVVMAGLQGSTRLYGESLILDTNSVGSNGMDSFVEMRVQKHCQSGRSFTNTPNGPEHERLPPLSGSIPVASKDSRVIVNRGRDSWSSSTGTSQGEDPQEAIAQRLWKGDGQGAFGADRRINLERQLNGTSSSYVPSNSLKFRSSAVRSGSKAADEAKEPKTRSDKASRNNNVVFGQSARRHHNRAWGNLWGRGTNSNTQGNLDSAVKPESAAARSSRSPESLAVPSLINDQPDPEPSMLTMSRSSQQTSTDKYASGINHTLSFASSTTSATSSSSSSSSSSSAGSGSRQTSSQNSNNSRSQSERGRGSSSNSKPQEGTRVWKSAVDPKSGRTYYYDAMTRETQWRKPLELATEEERRAVEEKERRQKDFFRDMEANILKCISKGQPAPAAKKVEEEIEEPAEMKLKKPTSLAGPAKPSASLAKSSLVRTISTMDNDLIAQLTTGGPQQAGPADSKKMQGGGGVGPSPDSVASFPASLTSTWGSSSSTVLPSPASANPAPPLPAAATPLVGGPLSATRPTGGRDQWLIDQVRKAAEQMTLTSGEAAAAAVSAEPQPVDAAAPAPIAEGDSDASNSDDEKSPAKSVDGASEKNTRRSMASKSLVKPNLSKRNTCGTMYVGSTLSAPDKDATIKCVCGVYRAHIINSTTEEGLHNFNPSVKFDEYEVFNDNPDARRAVSERGHRGHRKSRSTSSIVLTVPSLDEITTFYRDVFRRSQMESDCIIMSLVYVERLIKETNGGVRPRVGNWRSILFSSMIMASKVWDDLSMWNADFSQTCPSGVRFTLKRINELEVAMLECLKFNVKVLASEYAKYYFLLRSMLIRSGLAGDDLASLSPLDVEGAKKLEHLSATFETRSSFKTEASNARRSRSLGEVEGTSTFGSRSSLVVSSEEDVPPPDESLSPRGVGSPRSSTSPPPARVSLEHVVRM